MTDCSRFLFLPALLALFPISQGHCKPAKRGLVESNYLSLARLQSREFAVTGNGCELKKFHVESFAEVTRNPFHKAGEMVAAPMIAAFETTAPGCLRDYAVVQYIKGCTFYSYRYPKSGKMRYDFAFSRRLRGKTVIFQHPDWEVDSDDIDPMYNAYRDSSDPAKRHNVYRVPVTPLKLKSDLKSLHLDFTNIFGNNEWKLIGDRDPSRPLLFIRDYPTSANYDSQYPDTAMNVSFAFRTCLFRTQDVPTSGDPKPPGTPLEEGGPLECFDWDHNQIFNFSTGRFEKSETIHPFCLQPRPELNL